MAIRKSSSTDVATGRNMRVRVGRTLPKLKSVLFPSIDIERERRSFLPFEMEEKFTALLDDLGCDDKGKERVVSSVVKAVEKVRKKKARGK